MYMNIVFMFKLTDKTNVASILYFNKIMFLFLKKTSLTVIDKGLQPFSDNCYI